MRSGFLISLLLLFPTFVSAACSAEGATVIYVNGILTTLTQAQKDLQNIKDEYVSRTGDTKVNFYNGYNPSHLGGAGDLLQAVAQIFEAPVSTFDRDTILNQIHPEVTTRKLLLLGHSQGTMYANEMYDYLLTHGEPREAVGVYNIASPAKFVAGDGKHLNAYNDSLLRELETHGISVLPRNVSLDNPSPEDADSAWPGHGISRAYLASAPERIVGELQESLGGLEPAYATETGECFTPPGRDAAYKAKQLFYTVADPLVGGGLAAAKTTKDITLAVLGGAYRALASVGDAVTPEPRTENLAGSHTLVQKIFGSSLSEQDLIDFGLVELPASPPQPQEEKVAEGEVKGVETEPPPANPPPASAGPLIPPPPPPIAGGGGISAGFGGGGGAPAPAPVVEEAPVVEAPAVQPTPQPAPPPPSPPSPPPPDTTPPVLTITGEPADGSTITLDQLGFLTFEATDSESGVSHFLYKINGVGFWEACTSPLDLRNLVSFGRTQIGISVADKAGNFTTDYRTFTMVESQP